ncbi:WD40 repeat-like protein [Lactarius psammicola]|nr:WD40 repeat-like protein [Lactarius psammicola]
MNQHPFHKTFGSSRPLSLIALSEQRKRSNSAAEFYRTLDRVSVLGDGTNGHTGCVNALHWANDGAILLSGSDDTTVCVWRTETGETIRHTLRCQSVVDTGHSWNIFSVKTLPLSSNIATAAGDGQVRVFDLLRSARTATCGYGGTKVSPLLISRCHSGYAKRIAVEDSPSQFLSVGEDGTVRQHDMRVPHQCKIGCPAPLAKLPHPLSTLSNSPLASHLFVVAGHSPYGYLFDRRHSGRFLKEEWGVSLKANDFTTCVRRFGRKSRGWGESRGDEYITGARMSSKSSHEVLLSYSSDAVYLYSIMDDATDAVDLGSREYPDENVHVNHLSALDDLGVDIDDETMQTANATTLLSHYLESTSELDSNDEDVQGYEHSNSDVPIVLPRRRYAGTCNIETIKDVNFLGPNDEYVVSGSDDGNWFMWDKNSGDLLNILEGDGSIVNIVEGHPHLPVVATSGIDSSIKLFAPAPGPSQFSRIHQARRIISRHSEAALERLSLSRLLEVWGTRRISILSESEPE